MQHDHFYSKDKFTEIIVRDKDGRITKTFYGSLLNPLVLDTLGNRVVIKREGTWKSENYIIGENESVEAK